MSRRIIKSNMVLCFILTFSVNLMGQDDLPPRISSAAADSHVEARIEAVRARDAALKTETLLEPSLRETSVDLDDRMLVMRKVAPMAIPQAPVIEQGTLGSQGFSAETLRMVEEAQILEPVYLRLSATVYGSEYSELTLSVEEDRFIIWTNLDYSYLPFLGDFVTETRRYTYTGFNYRITPEAERKQAAAAREHGFEYHSRWKESPVYFSSEEPEYIIVTEDGHAVPQEVYHQLDDLMSYYLEHFDLLKRSSDNVLVLRAAQERYDATHTVEAPQDIILNYSRVSEPSK